MGRERKETTTQTNDRENTHDVKVRDESTTIKVTALRKEVFTWSLNSNNTEGKKKKERRT